MELLLMLLNISGVSLSCKNLHLLYKLPVATCPSFNFPTLRACFYNYFQHYKIMATEAKKSLYLNMNKVCHIVVTHYWDMIFLSTIILPCFSTVALALFFGLVLGNVRIPLPVWSTDRGCYSISLPLPRIFSVSMAYIPYSFPYISQCIQ